jgi:hypothetical protein
MQRSNTPLALAQAVLLGGLKERKSGCEKGMRVGSFEGKKNRETIGHADGCDFFYFPGIGLYDVRHRKKGGDITASRDDTA